jgi:isoquinoline 1-oxidoreductase beta subunit
MKMDGWTVRRVFSGADKETTAVKTWVDGPVKVVWTREEDIQHEMYRPCFFDRLSAGLDEKGKPVAYKGSRSC